MNEICKQCSAGFEVTDDDLSFYKKISPVIKDEKFDIPTPSICPGCRIIRRFSWRNDMNLFHRKCDKTGENLISMFHPDSPITVYKQDIWWSDDWDPLDYGRDFDFNRSFFEQFNELNLSLPHMHIAALKTENSLYTNYNVGNKNCYMCSAGNHSQDCMYCYNAQNSSDCLDSDFVWDSEKLYQCVMCEDMYNCSYCVHSKNCKDSLFLEDCSSCSECMLCFNLRNKKNCILNKEYSREEYLAKKSEFFEKGFDELFELWKTERLKYPKKENHNVQTENCTGEYIHQSKNCHECYIMAKGCEDCKYVVNGFPYLKDSYDCTYCGENASLIYECIGTGINESNILLSNLCDEGCYNMIYCNYCFGCHDCFACSNLRKKQYCVFNKQYSKEDYQEIVSRIIQHMQKIGEWGEFFPMQISPFAYNESCAYQYLPLSEEQVENLGLKWRVPGEDVTKDIVGANVKTCSVTGKFFKILDKEKEFYSKMELPEPTKCYEQRHKDRMELMNGLMIYDRNCDKCGKGIRTNYSPDGGEIIYCEECYLGEVY
ncbi:hypothetical protein ACFL21_04155 [Patescibacteria group bacterium]